MDKLKLCPFCKHPAKIVETPISGGVLFRIECPHCGTTQPSVFRPNYILRFYGEREMALKQIIDVWNLRDKFITKRVRIK